MEVYLQNFEPAGHLSDRANLTQAARRRGAKAAGVAVSVQANEAYAFLFPTVRELRADGLTYQAFADRLKDAGHTTRRGSTWTATAAMRVCNRAGAAAGQSLIALIQPSLIAPAACVPLSLADRRLSPPTTNELANCEALPRQFKGGNQRHRSPIPSKTQALLPPRERPQPLLLHLVRR